MTLEPAIYRVLHGVLKGETGIKIRLRQETKSALPACFWDRAGICAHSLAPYVRCACFDNCHVLHGAAGQDAAVKMSMEGFKQAWDSEKIIYFLDIKFQEVPSMRNGKTGHFRQLTKS